MWTSWVVAGVALAGVAFMLRFLAALLRENAPSVCYWIVPVRQETEKEKPLKVLRGIYFADDCRAMESDRGNYCWELLENEHHANQECISGLMALGLRPVSDTSGRRSSQPKHGYFFRERRL
ncbi:MAG: hypothetical protein WAK89_08785 [Candidatus Sulfotelmatobacter sp.]